MIGACWLLTWLLFAAAGYWLPPASLWRLAAVSFLLASGC
jgi:hypothetical protein